MTTPAEFRTLLDSPEGTRIEFKQATNSFHFDELVQYSVALANEGGGKIVLGVSDKRPRQVGGTKAFAEPGRTEAGLAERLGHRTPVEEYSHEGSRVLIVHVPARLPGSAWNDRGTYWMRSGEALVPMADDRLAEIHREVAPDFTEQACQASTLADLDSGAIAAFRSRWATRVKNDRMLAWKDAETLAAAEMITEGHPNFAALILFGVRAALSKHLAQAEVVFEYRPSDASGPAAERVEFREGFMVFHDQLWSLIDKRNDRQSYQEGFFRVEVPTFDEAAVREAVLNAVCHRDYRRDGSVFIRQFPHRLEVENPGGLPAGVTVQNILDEQNPRNRRLAEALSRCGLIERSGQGVNLMFERAILQSKPLPDFAGSTGHKVRVTLDGTMADPTFLRFLERVGRETLATFSTQDLLALDFVRREERLPDALKARVGHLRDLGVVETVGRGRGSRILLSRRFHAALGQKGAYTRRRGLDRAQNKELLVKHLVGCGATGCQISELQEVVPGISRALLKRLLDELRREKRTRLDGTRRRARWFVT